jgi:hypothetical protein
MAISGIAMLYDSGFAVDLGSIVHPINREAPIHHDLFAG